MRKGLTIGTVKVDKEFFGARLTEEYDDGLKEMQAFLVLWSDERTLYFFNGETYR